MSAKLLGHDYIGIDISRDYVELAKVRLERAQEELSRVLKERELHSVSMTFEERKKRGYWNKKTRQNRLL